MNDTEQFEELYRKSYHDVEYYITRILLHNANSASILQEDLIQRVYAVAWQKRETVLSLENPTGWLIECAKRVYKSILRDEAKWSANVDLVDEIRDTMDVQELVELKVLLEDEDFYILKRHYGDGVPYQILCSELQIGKSALAMRLKRAKERFLELMKIA